MATNSRTIPTVIFTLGLGLAAGCVMDAEYLFWDNQEFLKEIGLGK